MTLKVMHWSGIYYSLSIRRHWQTLYGLATVFTINGVRMEKLLPEIAGHHIMDIYEFCQGLEEYFATFDDWWLFSLSLCDQYCECFVLKRRSKDNEFNKNQNTRIAVQNFAKASYGYIGPDDWKVI